MDATDVLLRAQSGWRRSPRPPRHDVAGEIEEVQHASYALVDHIVDALRAIVERWNGRHDDRAHSGGLVHQRDVTCMERSLPQHQYQAASFLETDVGRAHDEVF